MKLARLSLLLLSALACTTAPVQPEPRPTAAEARARMSSKERHDRLVEYFPNIELTTHEGEKVRFYDDVIYDRTVLIHFMYTTCDGI